MYTYMCIHVCVYMYVYTCMYMADEPPTKWDAFPTKITTCIAVRGHLSHHKNLGRSSMGQLFDSDRLEFEVPQRQSCNVIF